MIAFDEARKIVVSQAQPTGQERLSLEELSGLVLAEPLIAEFDLPSFDNSAVDGFGVLVSDVQSATNASPVTLALKATVQAGDRENIKLRPGSTIKLLTGAMVPPGIEAILMKEFCQQHDNTVIAGKSAHLGDNIRRKGEEFTKGEVILSPGTIISPSVVGLIASLGHASALVYKRPLAAIISTGNELIDPGKQLCDGQIYDSNSYALMAALSGFGIENCFKLHVKDERESTQNALSQALMHADIVISAGGVSVGDFDFVKDVLEELGVETQFWQVAIKPGKPIYFGVYKTVDENAHSTKKFVFGLPGNPVSALVTFHQLVKPALLKMLGLNSIEPKYFTARLAHTLKKRPGRLEFVRACLKHDAGNLIAVPTTGQESHMLGGLAAADCLIHFPLEKEKLEEGEQALVELLNWSTHS